MAVFDKISDALGIENAITTVIPTVIEHNSTIGDTSDAVNLESDYIKARSNLLALSEKLNNLIDSAILVAESSETPRAYEVAGGLLNNAIDINNALIGLIEKKKKIKNLDVGGDTTKNVTNNTMFVGSTTELLKHLAKIK